jgi:predicted dehydrogenase
VDFWRDKGPEVTGRIVPVEEPKAFKDTVSGRFQLVAPGNRALGFIEQSFRFQAKGRLRLVDVHIRIEAGRGVPLKLGDTEEGALGLRLRDEFREDRGAVLVNSDGLTGSKNIWGKRARWVDYSTAIGGEKAGVTILDHPANPKHPTYWHARNYGLCAANPFGEHDFLKDKTRDGSVTVPAGQSLMFHYRLVIHPGMLERRKPPSGGRPSQGETKTMNGAISSNRRRPRRDRAPRPRGLRPCQRGRHGRRAARARAGGGFSKFPDASVECLIEVDERVLGRAVEAVEQAGRKRPRVVGDLRRALEDKSIDAVVVATPDHWHAPAAILACEAGKDVYLEKPCSHNVREGRLVVEAARRHHRIVQHGTQGRSRESTRRAIEYVHSGKLGRVLMAKAWDVQKRRDIGRKPDSPPPPQVDYDTWVGPAPLLPFNENRFHYEWHWHWNFGTGDAGNDGAHQIDMARWALGVQTPDEVAGLGRKLCFDDDQQTPDTLNATFSYPGKLLMFELRIWNPYGMGGAQNGVAVYGTDAMLEIAKWDREWGFKVWDRDGKLALHEKAAGEDEAHVRNFLDCVRSRRAPNAEIETGHHSALHCHLANIVARTGRAIRFDPATETIPGDAEANRLLGREYRRHWGTPKGV